MSTLQTNQLDAEISWKLTAGLARAVRPAREYVPTFGTEFAVMASQVLTYWLAAHYLGKSGFSEYALARRTVSLLFPIPVLGLTVGLPRYMGLVNGLGDTARASRYYGATLWCVGSAVLLCLALINVFARSFAYLLFGDRVYAYLCLPLSVMILGLCVHVVVCAYFRGNHNLNYANILQFINLAVVPVLAFVLFGHSLARALTATGSVWTLCAAIGLLMTPFHSVTSYSWEEGKELLFYGIQRVPGDFILVALFTLPATFVAHLRGIQEAGFVAFGISVVSIIGSVFAPASLVLLPKATFMFAEGAHDKLRVHLRQILGVTLVASSAIVLGIWIWIPELIRLYLGAGFEQVVPIVRMLAVSALPYSLYLVLRNLLDAYHDYGVTAAILSVGLAIFLAGSYIGARLRAQTIIFLLVFNVAQVAIALLSGWECRRIFRSKQQEEHRSAIQIN